MNQKQDYYDMKAVKILDLNYYFLSNKNITQMTLFAFQVCLGYYISLAFFHLHEIAEGLYFHCSLSMCLCVCECVKVCVCPALLVHKIPAERMNRFGPGFR